LQAEEKATTQCSMGVSRGQIQCTCRSFNQKGRKKQKSACEAAATPTTKVKQSTWKTVEIQFICRLFKQKERKSKYQPVRLQWVKTTVKQSAQKNKNNLPAGHSIGKEGKQKINGEAAVMPTARVKQSTQKHSSGKEGINKIINQHNAAVTNNSSQTINPQKIQFTYRLFKWKGRKKQKQKSTVRLQWAKNNSQTITQKHKKPIYLHHSSGKEKKTKTKISWLQWASNNSQTINPEK